MKRQAKGYALQILREKQMKHSKMDNLYYSELKLQTYFKIPGIQTKEVLTLFKWSVGMAPLAENFRGNSYNILCPLCEVHLEKQSTILQCEVIRKQMRINCGIDDIYREKIKLETAKKMTEIEEFSESRRKEK